MTTTIAFAEPLWTELTASLSERRETAAVLFAGIAEEDERLLLTVNRIVWVPDDAYEERTPTSLRIASRGWMPALKHAAKGHWCAIFFHTHPQNKPSPSPYDDGVDAVLGPVFRTRTDGTRYASVILGEIDGKPVISGRVYEDDGDPTAIDRVRIAGQQLRVGRAAGARDEADLADAEVYDRQIRAFGKDGQRILHRLRVGIVGCGGTGSSVAEQLTRLGIGSLVLVDDDKISDTNVTRVYGSRIVDEHRPKVEVLRDHLANIGLGTAIDIHDGRITHREHLMALRGCDLVFGCTDNNSSRLTLSRLAYWYLMPVIDMAVVIKSADEKIIGVYGRVTIAAPGEPCLLCRGEVDPRLATQERYSKEERQRLAEEGYAEGLDDPDPAVIAYTTMTAAHAVADFLQRLFGFETARLSGRYRLQISDKSIRRNGTAIRDGCYCSSPEKWGRGDHEPLLGLTWPG
jgi:molybdopterin/thiamine biosynthesis adenylyltransferase